MARFEVVSKYTDINLPKRQTEFSAGYDFEVAKDIIIEPYEHCKNILETQQDYLPIDLQTLSSITKRTKVRPTLVPTGIKCKMAADEYLEISVRSSCPLKYWLILANGVGIIDSDYYNNPSNEGHIFVKLKNEGDNDIILKKYDRYVQGIIQKYYIVDNENEIEDIRVGGIGSSGRRDK